MVNASRMLICMCFKTFAVEQAMKNHRESRGIALFVINLSAKWGRVVNATPRPIYPRERSPVPIVQEAAWVLGMVWTGAENLASPTRRKLPDRASRSESLYRLSYRGSKPFDWLWLLSARFRGWFCENGNLHLVWASQSSGWLVPDVSEVRITFNLNGLLGQFGSWEWRCYVAS
jgi:hypothetical protein